MPRRKGPKSRKPAAKKQALKLLGKRRLSPTKNKRRSFEQALDKRLGYHVPKLSDVVNKPSRHTVKKRVVQIRTEKATTQGRYVDTGRTGYWGGPVREWVPGKTTVTTKPVGEKLIVKRLIKRRRARKGGGGGERGSHRTGTMQARRSEAKKAARASGKKGARPKRQKRKKKKK